MIFASFQDAIGEGGNKQKWNKIKNQEIDMLVIDEMHYGSDTKKALDVINSLNYKFSFNLSGTPLKALQRGSYTKNQQYHWTYMNEQFAKNMGITYEDGKLTTLVRLILRKTTTLVRLCCENSQRPSSF